MRKELEEDFHQRKVRKENARKAESGHNVFDTESDSIRPHVNKV